MVALAKAALQLLRSCVKDYMLKMWLFEGQGTEKHYSRRSAPAILNAAYKKAGPPGSISFRSLRHSFANHLLDKGTDIRYIKDLPDHFGIKTTERYLHVSKKQLVNVLSPLDDLMKREKIDW